MAHKKDEIRAMLHNDEAVNNALKELAAICDEAYCNGVKYKNNSYLRKEMFDKNLSASGKHNPERSKCDWESDKKNPEKETEKRICRCMYYYDNCSDECRNKCPLNRKWCENEDSKIKVVGYEMPMSDAVPGVGGIDLLLDDGNEKYAVETKRPEGNVDTIALMFAEIMTYTCDTEYLPAIAVFENGFHHRKIKKLLKEKNEYFLKILKYIKIFIISYSENSGIANYSIDFLHV